jgi:hypothetical protein
MAHKCTDKKFVETNQHGVNGGLKLPKKVNKCFCIVESVNLDGVFLLCMIKV